MVVVWVVLSTLVLIEKPAEDSPAGMTTLQFTVAAPVLLLESVTTAPPAGATEPIVTVPVEVLPPVTELGLRVKLSSQGGLIVTTDEKVFAP